MKKRLIILVTMLFILMMAVPAMAEVNLDVNGKAYKPAYAPQVEAGTTMIPVSVAARTLGADLTIQDKQIELNKNGNILKMTEGSLAASYNGEDRTMPRAPELKDGEMLVPLRFVCESLSAQVLWQEDAQTVAIQYQEKRNDMSAEEMLGKSSQALADANTYKMKLNMDMTLGMQSGSEGTTMNMKTQADCAYQEKPLVMYMKQQLSGASADSSEKIENVKAEVLVNESGMYMTMPDYDGWIKLEVPGLDIKALMEQAGGQDVMSSITKMKESGMLLNYGNDGNKDGKDYWVLNITMSPDSFQNYLQSLMKQVPEVFNPPAEAANAENPLALEELFKNMQVDMFYQMWIDQKTFLPQFLDLDANMDLTMKIDDENKNPVEMSVQSKQNAKYELYDFGIDFSVPDVSSAISMSDYMAKQTAEMGNANQ
ncbi:MAG TPA: hypothetical protein DER33_08220 [Syntrophomonas sp.]|jgi:hypothetical protein|nr:hypothetical protein [Syntrophomonas sp.]